MAIKNCPKCGSDNISYQREQTASVGASTNKVVIKGGANIKLSRFLVCVQ